MAGWPRKVLLGTRDSSRELLTIPNPPPPRFFRALLQLGEPAKESFLR